MAERQWKLTLVYVAVILVGVSLAVAFYFYQVFYRSDRFLPGVEIASLQVSGRDRVQAEQKLDAHLQTVYQQQIIFYHNDYFYYIDLNRLCEPVDVSAAINKIWDSEHRRGIGSKLLNMDGSRTISYPLTVKYRPEVLSAIEKEWNQQLGSRSIDAQLEVDPVKGLVILPGQTGEQVDMSKTLAALPGDWGQMRPMRAPIEFTEVNPEIKEKDLQYMGELATFSTWFNVNEINRSNNLRRATRTINGTMVAPQEVFSFNKTVGPRTFESGYNDAMVIVGGKFEPGLGGGICQVSSTLYNACLLAGLEIVERHNHNLSVAYVALGRDATVAYGIQDFRFRNHTDSPLYIRAVTSGGQLTINVYGNLKYKQRIEINHVVDGVIPFSEVNLDDDTLEPGVVKVDHAGIPGYKVRSFRIFYDSNGQVTRREQLASDYYQPLHKYIYHGPALPEPDVNPEDGWGGPPITEIPADQVPTGDEVNAGEDPGFDFDRYPNSNSAREWTSPGE